MEKHLLFLQILSPREGKASGEPLFTSPGEQLRDGRLALTAILGMKGIFLY